MIEDSRDFKTIDAKFPNIGQKLKVFWGYKEFVTLMRELETDSGDRPRAGFPGDVLMALHELHQVHDLAYPQLAFKDKSIWNI